MKSLLRSAPKVFFSTSWKLFLMLSGSALPLDVPEAVVTPHRFVSHILEVFCFKNGSSNVVGITRLCFRSTELISFVDCIHSPWKCDWSPARDFSDIRRGAPCDESDLDPMIGSLKYIFAALSTFWFWLPRTLCLLVSLFLLHLVTKYTAKAISIMQTIDVITIIDMLRALSFVLPDCLSLLPSSIFVILVVDCVRKPWLVLGIWIESVTYKIWHNGAFARVQAVFDWGEQGTVLRALKIMS